MTELSTVGSMATHVVQVLNLTGFVSGNMIQTVNNQRIYVQNFTGDSIDENNIESKYQPAILNLSLAVAIEAAQAQEGGGNLKLAELSVSDSDSFAAAESFKKQAEDCLKYLGRDIQIGKTVV